MIRRATDTDTDRLCEIWLYSNLDAHNFIPEKYWRDNLPLVRESLKEAEIYVFEYEDISGFIGLTELIGVDFEPKDDPRLRKDDPVIPRKSGVKYIAGLFVDASKRSKGTGKALLDFAKRKNDCLYLSVYEKNPRAVSFYLREGFEIIKENIDEATGEKELQMCFIKS